MELTELLAEMPETAKKAGGISTKLSFEDELARRAEWDNAIPGHLTGLDCPICKNRGTVTEVRGKYLVSIPCKCMTRRRCLRQIERSGLKDLLERYTLDSFHVDEPWQAEMKRSAEDYIQNGGDKWFAALGSVGSGKTHICTAICAALLDAGKEVRYVLWCEEAVRLNALVTDANEYERAIQPLISAQVLYIDDLFKTKQGAQVGPGEVRRAFDVINRRIITQGQTIISSEKTMGELMDIDQAVASRIYEKSDGYRLKLTGNKNRRLL